MEISKILWVNGSFVELDQANFPLLSHSLHYGSAIFEGIRFYETETGAAVFRLTEHLDRFIHSANAIHFPFHYSKKELAQVIIETIKQNNIFNGYIRLIGFFGDGDMELHPTSATLNIAVILWPWAPRMGNTSINLKISSFMRTPPQSTIITAKLSGHYANSILARQEARHLGYHEALLLDLHGNIAEASGANFFAVKNSTLITPPAENCFPGITRDSVLTIAKDLGFTVQVEHIQPEELSSFDEVFLTGTAMELISVSSIDQIKIKNQIGPITSRLKEIYLSIAHDKLSGYRHWLIETTGVQLQMELLS